MTKTSACSRNYLKEVSLCLPTLSPPQLHPGLWPLCRWTVVVPTSVTTVRGLSTSWWQWLMGTTSPRCSSLTRPRCRRPTRSCHGKISRWVRPPARNEPASESRICFTAADWWGCWFIYQVSLYGPDNHEDLQTELHTEWSVCLPETRTYDWDICAPTPGSRAPTSPSI